MASSDPGIEHGMQRSPTSARAPSDGPPDAGARCLPAMVAFSQDSTTSTPLSRIPAHEPTVRTTRRQTSSWPASLADPADLGGSRRGATDSGPAPGSEAGSATPYDLPDYGADSHRVHARCAAGAGRRVSTAGCALRPPHRRSTVQHSRSAPPPAGRAARDQYAHYRRPAGPAAIGAYELESSRPTPRPSTEFWSRASLYDATGFATDAMSG